MGARFRHAPCRTPFDQEYECDLSKFRLLPWRCQFSCPHALLAFLWSCSLYATQAGSPRHEIRFLRQPDRRACTPSRSIGRGTHLYAYPVIVTAKRDLVSACHWLMPQLRRGVQKSRTINVASGIGHRISSTSSMPENLVHLLCPSFIFVPMQHKHESSIDVYPPQDLTALYAHSATRTCGDIGC